MLRKKKEDKNGPKISIEKLCMHFSTGWKNYQHMATQ